MSIAFARLGVVAPAKPIRKKVADDSQVVWQLNLDQVEAQSGRVLKQIRLPVREAGNSTHWFGPEHVLYSKLRPYLNKVVIPEEEGIATTELVPLLPDSDLLDRRYLAHYLRSEHFVSWISSQVAGAKMPRVSMRVFWEHEIPLPSILDQRRIGITLDRAESIRRKRQQAIVIADEFLRSMFLKMFGDPVTNSHVLKKRGVATFCRLVRGSSPRPKGDPQFYGGPVPRLMVQDLTRDGFYVTPTIDSLTYEGAKKSRPVEAGTVVMAVSGNVGLAAILEIDACVHDGFVAFTSLDGQVILPEYLLYVMTLLKVTHKNREAGAIFKNLTTTQIKDMEIPIPPIPQQVEFSKIVAQFSSLRQILVQSAEDSDLLLRSIGLKAFSLKPSL